VSELGTVTVTTWRPPILTIPPATPYHRAVPLQELRRAQYFTYGKWTGGMYVTPTIAGSRAGALIACAWASLVTIGEAGFRTRVKLIMDTSREIARGISAIEGIQLLGCKGGKGGDGAAEAAPHAMVVCFAADDSRSNNGSGLNIYEVAEAMKEKGWNLNSLQNPPCVHICVTLQTVRHKDKFVTDLRDAVKGCTTAGTGGGGGGTKKADGGGSAAIYGMAGSMPAGPVNELLKAYMDITMSC